MRAAARAVAASLALALPVGVLWWLVTPLPRLVTSAGGVAVAPVAPGGGETAIAADGWFVVVALAAGLVTGVASYAVSSDGRLGALLGLVVGGVCGAVLAWRIGILFGPAPVADSAADLADGARFDGPLVLSAPGALLAWPLGAVLSFIAFTAGAGTASAAAPPGETSPGTVISSGSS